MNTQDAPADKAPTNMMRAESMVLPKSKVLHRPKVKAAMITQALPPVAVFRIQPAY